MHKHLPQNAKKVFQGVIFDVWQWGQEMFDGSVETFECITRPGTVFAVPVIGDKIMVQREEQPGRKSFISLPGGRCDSYDEDSLECAKRELLEETGHSSDSWKLWLDKSSRGKILWPFHVYVARDCLRAKKPHLDSGEKIEPYLISFDDFLMLADDPDFRVGELREPLLRARFDDAEREKLKEFLFG